MTEFGWCIAEQQDVPISADRCCLTDGSITIAPSWATARTVRPWPERPADYAYIPPAYLRGTQRTTTPEPGKHFANANDVRTAKVVTAVRTVVKRPSYRQCDQCGATMTARTPRGDPRRFCTIACRRRHQTAVRTARERAEREQRPAPEPKPPHVPKHGTAICRCGKEFRPSMSYGIPQRYCSRSCASIATAERGAERRRRICVTCGATFIRDSSKANQKACSLSCAAKGREQKRRKVQIP